MPDLNFAQPERRSFLVPGLIAIAVLAAAFATAEHFLPSTHPEAAVTQVSAYATHTVFKTHSIVVGKQDPSQDDLYLVTSIHIDNQLRSPLDLKDFTATLTPSGAEPLTSSSIQKPDLPNLLLTFPALKPLVHAPLLRETTIPPGQSAAGDLIFHFPADKPAYDHRTAFTITLTPYRQPPITLTIPSPKPSSPTPVS